MERAIMADCQRAVAFGQELKEASVEAFADALKERARADLRAAEPVLLPTGEPDAFKAIDQMRADIERVDYRVVARERLGLVKRQSRLVPTLSADEDLLGDRGQGGMREYG
jgi:hypothetical protein